jgi:hypothetical protein
MPVPALTRGRAGKWVSTFATARALTIARSYPAREWLRVGRWSVLWKPRNRVSNVRRDDSVMTADLELYDVDVVATGDDREHERLGTAPQGRVLEP